MGEITITIPTYWSWRAGQPGLPQDSIFDHPTAIDREGTLGRCLESLAGISGPAFRVLIITAPVNERLSEEVERKVESIIAPFRKRYPIAQFGPPELAMLRRSLEQRGLDPSLVSLASYARIRNCQLLGSIALDSELVAAIDDDEIVPGDYLAKAAAFIGKKQGSRRVDGVAGLYLNPEGDWRLKETPGIRAQSNNFRRKAALMNDEFASYLEQPERLVETAVVLGGNMIFSRELFQRVPFDPGITRGEDIDYLLNSRLLGFHWFLDKELVITHLPPPPSAEDPLNTSPYAKLQQDVIRFVYQRAKLRLSQQGEGIQPVSAQELGLYPGEFLKEDLEEQALEALTALRPEEAPAEFFPQPEELMRLAAERAQGVRDFLSFKEQWPSLVAVAAADRELKQHLLGSMGY